MGAEEARLFASEGAKVVLGDVLDEEGEKTAAEIGESAVYVHLDVTSEADWCVAVEKTEQAFGKLDILVNNAGILRFGLLEHTPLEEFESVVKVNQTGTFLGMKSIVAAIEFGAAGIRVNSIHPGGIETRMTHRATRRGGEPGSLGRLGQEFLLHRVRVRGRWRRICRSDARCLETGASQYANGLDLRRSALAGIGGTRRVKKI
jgi:NAD(P)-dependent dehydrogenase (short-subunit alcohol dehydrogenase family)